MATNQPAALRHGYRKFKFIGAALLVLIAACIVGLLIIRNHRTSSVQTGGQTAYNNAKKEATVNNNGEPVNDSALGNKGDSPSGSYTPPNNNDGITIAPSQSGGKVTISTKLVGYSDGTCTLVLDNAGRNTTQTADVIFAPNYSSCAGFTEPVSALGSGTWNITLSVLSGGITTSKSMTFEVSQ